MNSHSQRGNMPLRDMILTSLMAAIVFAFQLALAPLPNIEIVSFLFIMYTICFSPKQALIASYIFCLLEGLIFGFGIWWVMYLYVWQIMILVAWIFRKNDSIIIWAVISGSFGLFFGALCSVPYILTGGLAAGIAWWLSGLPFDIMHCIGNIVVMLVLYKPISAFFYIINSKTSLR